MSPAQPGPSFHPQELGSNNSVDLASSTDKAATASRSPANATSTNPSQQTTDADEEEGDEERMDLGLLQSFAE